jgi:RNA polymerase sigma-70 factor, ECF subfamily
VRQQPLLEMHDILSRGSDSQEQILQREMVDHLYKAIHRLSSIDAALVLLYLDDLSYREMAIVMGISDSNVGIRLNRAKKKLATLLSSIPSEDTNDES